MQVETLFREKEARLWVSCEIREEIGRTSFYRWRCFLNLLDSPYTLSDLKAIAYFGYRVKAGETLETAKQRTIQHLRSNQNV